MYKGDFSSFRRKNCRKFHPFSPSNSRSFHSAAFLRIRKALWQKAYKTAQYHAFFSKKAAKNLVNDDFSSTFAAKFQISSQEIGIF